MEILIGRLGSHTLVRSHPYAYELHRAGAHLERESSPILSHQFFACMLNEIGALFEI